MRLPPATTGLLWALLFGYLNHAVSMFESKYASREDIDDAMRLGCGYPMGPLMLLDLIGLDTAYQILDTMYRQSRDRLHAPAPILKQMVTAGLKGRKTGRGFYTYAGPNSPEIVDDGAAATVDSSVEPLPVQRVGVVGSGTMATGIAEVLAHLGHGSQDRQRPHELARELVARIEFLVGDDLAHALLRSGTHAEVGIQGAQRAVVIIAALLIYALVEALLKPGTANDRLLATPVPANRAGDRRGPVGTAVDARDTGPEVDHQPPAV